METPEVEPETDDFPSWLRKNNVPFRQYDDTKRRRPVLVVENDGGWKFENHYYMLVESLTRSGNILSVFFSSNKELSIRLCKLLTDMTKAKHNCIHCSQSFTLQSSVGAFECVRHFGVKDFENRWSCCKRAVRGCRGYMCVPLAQSTWIQKTGAREILKIQTVSDTQLGKKRAIVAGKKRDFLVCTSIEQDLLKSKSAIPLCLLAMNLVDWPPAARIERIEYRNSHNTDDGSFQISITQSLVVLRPYQTM